MCGNLGSGGGTVRAIEQHKKVIDNLQKYIRIGHIKSANDEWFQYHKNSYEVLKARHDFWVKERKRLKR